MIEYSFTVVIEQDEDGWYIAHVPALQGCHTQGKTEAEAYELIEDAIRRCRPFQGSPSPTSPANRSISYSAGRASIPPIEYPWQESNLRHLFRSNALHSEKSLLID